MSATIVGVRHHSPACARLVRWTIAQVRPRLVLIEGPADMNSRMAELRLPHELPIAVYTYRTEAGRSHSSWSPFCAHSPEWIALETATRLGAEARFMDLPAWHPAFWGIENRYADRPHRTDRLAAGLCARFGASDADALWEHLFEQPMPEKALDERVRAYFAELRRDDPPDERDAPREAFMARCLAAAAREGPVVAVCGGWHAPALESSWPAAGNGSWPEVVAPPEGTRTGSYLVPYSFHRLDSFTGYESGMPSPAYQDAAFRLGPDQAAEDLLRRTVERLRARKQPVSPADVIAVASMAEGLRRLRGHASVSRIDLLDGLAAGLVKGALDVPLPWTYRGTIRPRTEPVLVEVMAAFAGDRVGRLAAGTPRPPLSVDARAELAAHGLTPARTPCTVTLVLTEAAHLAASRALHRLRVLGIPGFYRSRGPAWATDGTLDELWSIDDRLEAEGALIEAAAFGATLESAAAACLEEQLLAAQGRLATLAHVLGEAVFVGIGSLARRVLDQVARAIGAESSLGDLGAALASLLGLWRHDALLGSERSAALGAVIAAAFERGLWLFEGIRGSGPAEEPQLAAALALRDTLRHAAGRLGLDASQAQSVMERRATDASAPPALRGAALGFLWSTGFFATPEAGAEAGAAAVRRAGRPSVLGDFLAGLFLLAREEMLRSPGLVSALDALFVEMVEVDFLEGLPALRLAFSFFPPAEREQLARQVLAWRGGDPLEARALIRQETGAETTARAMALEAEVDRTARRFGLQDEEGR